MRLSAAFGLLVTYELPKIGLFTVLSSLPAKIHSRMKAP
jgi:hypothetical protein